VHRLAVWISEKEVLVVRVHRVYFRGGQYTDQVAASASAARLYAERLCPKLGARFKAECMMLVVDGLRMHVNPKLDRSFVLLVVPREQHA
jgi:hypothetical protein